VRPLPSGLAFLTAETFTYDSGHVMYVIVDYRIDTKKAIDRRIFESTSAQTRDYVLARMLEREAEKRRELVDIRA
jgi:hypothetical protein